MNTNPMGAEQRTEALFDKARRLGLVNPITGDGMPTISMVHETVFEAASDAKQLEHDLVVFVKRLVRAVRKHDPRNSVAAKAADFLGKTGNAPTFRQIDGPLI